MYRNIFVLFAGVFFLIADQATKFFLIHFLKSNETIPVIKNIFHITLILNTGCAFGLLKNQPTLFFAAISSIAIFFLFYHLMRRRQNLLISNLPLALIIAGALSNLIDRLRFGYVVDFLDFRIWPVFNLGDTAITIGAALLILRLLIRRKV